MGFMRICLYKGIYVYIIFNLYIYLFIYFCFICIYIYTQKHQHLPTARPSRATFRAAHVFFTSEAHVGVQKGIDELCDHLLSRGTHLPQLVRGKGEPGPLEIAALRPPNRWGKIWEIYGNTWETYGNIWDILGNRWEIYGG